MHTATRLAVGLIKRVQRINPQAHVCAYGLYAPVNERYLRQLGVQTILGGEFEQGLVDLAVALRDGAALPSLPSVSLARQRFLRPFRANLPPLADYAWLDTPAGRRTVGYTEASRGCKHLCRHCPIVPVYNGRFRLVQPDVVLADIRQQVEAGAQHITFGDPDFLNGPGHALPLVQALHAEFPDLTYDVTIKIEHLQKQADALPILRDTGCSFVVSAVEAVDDDILAILDKGHTRADLVQVARQMRQIGLPLTPTFVTFTPWTTVQGYADFLALMAELELVEAISPIQYAIRLLIPAGSRLLELATVQTLAQPFDEAALGIPTLWRMRPIRLSAVSPHGRARRQDVHHSLDAYRRGRTRPEHALHAHRGYQSDPAFDGKLDHLWSRHGESGPTGVHHDQPLGE